MHSAEQPSERERDRYSRIRLFFDGVAQCPLKGTGGLGGAVDGLPIEVLGGIRHFTGLFLGTYQCSSGIGIVGGQRAKASESSPSGTVRSIEELSDAVVSLRRTRILGPIPTDHDGAEEDHQPPIG